MAKLSHNPCSPPHQISSNSCSWLPASAAIQFPLCSNCYGTWQFVLVPARAPCVWRHPGAPLSAQAPSGRYAAALCSAATLLSPKRSRRSLAKVRPAEVLRGTPDPIKLQRPSSSTPLTAGGTSSLHRLKTSTLAPASVAKLLTFPHLLYFYCTNRDAFRAQVTWTFLPFAAS